MTAIAAKSILIATSSLDRLNIQPVVTILRKRGYHAVVYEPDSIARGERDVELRLTRGGDLAIKYDGRPFDPESFGAAWYRKPSFYGPAEDRLRWYSVQQNYYALEKVIWKALPPGIWLNDPVAMEAVAYKVTQMRVAASLGMVVPETVIGNRWEAVEAMPYDKLIVKLEEPVILPSEKGDKFFPTTIVHKKKLPKQVPPYPGMWQEYLAKKKEWRITVVGDKIFSAAIYTTDDAKDDWRKHSFTNRITFKAEAFSDEMGLKCIQFLKHFGLGYGAFDFIETPDGELIFLEVNSNGQFMWLEHDLGLPISEAIADRLVGIARSHPGMVYM